MAVITFKVGSAGTGRDYPTTAAAWAAIPDNVVASSNSYVLEHYNDSVFDLGGNTLNLGGKATDATHTITIKCANGQSFRDNANAVTNAYTYNPANGVAFKFTGDYANAINITTPYVTVTGLQVSHQGGGNSGAAINCGNGLPGLVIEGNILEVFPSGTYAYGLSVEDAAIRNNLIVLKSANSNGIFLGVSTGTLIENCTIVRPSDIVATSGRFAIVASNNGVTVRNCAVFNCPAFSTNIPPNQLLNNAYSGTIVGTGLSNVPFAAQFVGVTLSSGNYRTVSGSVLIDAGLAPSVSNTKAAVGVRQQGTAADIGSWEFPSSIQAPSITVSAITVTGTTVVISGTTTGTPTSGTIGIDVDSTPFNNGVTKSPINITFGSGTFTATFTNVQVGSYATYLNAANAYYSSIGTNPIGSFQVVGATAGSVVQSLDGQVYTLSGTTTGNPTSGNLYIPAASIPNGAIDKSVAVTLGSGTFSVSTTLTPGSYGAARLTLVNAAGTSFPQAGTSPVTVLSLSGNPQAGDGQTTGTATIPSAPTGVTATPGNGAAVVVFTAPADNGGATVTGYTVTASTGQTVSGTTSPITISVPNGVPVTFTVHANNSVGPGPESAPSPAITPALVVTTSLPGAPTSVVATAGNGFILVAFSAPASNGNAVITSYTVTTSGGQTASGNSSPISVAVPNGAAVTATVYATNSVGPGPQSDPSNSVLPQLPNTPINVVGVTVSPTGVSVVKGQTQQFNATVTGSGSGFKGTVVWSALFGAIDSSGVYLAPPTISAQIDTITATSVDDPSKNGTAIASIVTSDSLARLRSYSANVRNKAGVAVEGALVTVFDQNTGDKIQIWKDSNQIQEIENPIITDDEGYFTFYTKSGQCGYTVRGFGIQPYTRNDIFDIANDVDLGPVQNAITVLQQAKVGFSDLADAVANRASNADLVSLRHSVEALSAIVNQTVVVNKFVTGGDGSSAAPWTGWDTGISWSDNTEYRFVDGYYAYNESPNFAKNNIKLVGRAGTVIRHLGTGYAMLIDAGSASQSVSGVQVGVTLEGNNNSLGGVMQRGCFNSKFDFQFRNVPNVCFNDVSGVTNKYSLVRSTAGVAQTTNPTSVLKCTRRISSLQCSNNEYYVIAEGCTDYGIVLLDCSNSEFRGVSELNFGGLALTDTSQNNRFIGMLLNINTDKDILCSGSYNQFSGLRCGGSASFGGTRNSVVGGVYDGIFDGGISNTYLSLNYASSGGVFTDFGQNTEKRSIFNLSFNTYDVDTAQSMRDLTVAGKTILGSDTMIIGNGQLYKTPSGLFGINQTTFVNDAPLQVTNPNNTTTAEGFRMSIGALGYGTTAKLFNGNTGGGDVFVVYGNGNTVNQNNSYGALSDVSLKEHIVDATPKLDNLMNVRVVNYNLIGYSDKLLGVISQELETVFPGMVEAITANGKSYKTVKYSVFVPVLIKAVQELNQQLKALKEALHVQ